jgi:hypothetical protein
MVRIIYMATGAPVPSKADYVLVEPLPGGKFTARGSLINSHRVISAQSCRHHRRKQDHRGAQADQSDAPQSHRYRRGSNRHEGRLGQAARVRESDLHRSDAGPPDVRETKLVIEVSTP